MRTTTHDVYMSMYIYYSTNAKFSLRNAFLYSWESDFICCTRAGLHIEVEVKMSRSDFKADFKKTEKHRLFTNYKQAYQLSHWSDALTYWHFNAEHKYNIERLEYPVCQVDFKESGHIIPNKFYYACPEGLIQPEEVPPYAGLFWTSGCHARVVKKAPTLHHHKQDHRDAIITKLYDRVMNFERSNYYSAMNLPFGTPLKRKR